MKIQSVTFAYNVTALKEASDELHDVVKAKRYGERYEQRHGESLEMVPVAGARCCSCCCLPCREKVDVVGHYEAEEERLGEEVERQREIALDSPLGMAFVTFRSINDSRQVGTEALLIPITALKFKAGHLRLFLIFL